MVTPITADGLLDEPAVGRIVDSLAAGGVQGVFALGTTGEATSVPATMRDRLVQRVKDAAAGRMRVYAGISSNSLSDSVEAGSRYLRIGADAVVAHVPSNFSMHPEEHLHFFSELSDRLNGDLILYNMPMTTNVSLPINVLKETASRKVRVIGVKDSENNAERLGELLRELGGREGFSIFVGTGALMAKGLLLGADGIVPSVGNLVPSLCRRLYDCATNGGGNEVETIHRQLMDVSSLYQNGRTLGQSLAALKGAMTWLGLCGPDVFPPLKPTTAAERAVIRDGMQRLGLLPPTPGVGKETRLQVAH